MRSIDSNLETDTINGCRSDKRGFYPDFILWVKNGSTNSCQNWPRQWTRTKLKNVALNSFIVSATPYEDLRAKCHDGWWDRKRTSSFTRAARGLRLPCVRDGIGGQAETILKANIAVNRKGSTANTSNADGHRDSTGAQGRQGGVALAVLRGDTIG